MDIFRVNKDRDFMVVKNTIFKNKEITLKSKGLYALIMSLSDDWDFSVAGIVAICKEGRESLYASIKELELHGYCKKIKVRDSLGKIIKTEYSFYEEPINTGFAPQTGLQETGEPQTGLQETGNTSQYNTNTNKELNKENINFQKLLFYFNSVFSKSCRVFPKAVEKSFNLRIKEGYTKEDVLKVIDNASNDTLHKENNYKYVTLEFLSRPKIFERYASMKHEKPFSKNNGGHKNF